MIQQEIIAEWHCFDAVVVVVSWKLQSMELCLLLAEKFIEILHLCLAVTSNKAFISKVYAMDMI